MNNSKNELKKSIYKIIQNNIIDISFEKIENIYRYWNSDGKSQDDLSFNIENCVLDKQLIKKTQRIPEKPYLLGIDFPFWLGEQNFSNYKIMIIGIDPLRNKSHFDKRKADPYENVLIGTPYGIDFTKLNKEYSNAYFEFITKLSNTNFVYLTDIYKTFFYTDESKNERSYNFYNKDETVRKEVTEVLFNEIDLVKPNLIITLGGLSYSLLTNRKSPKLTKNIRENISHIKGFEKIEIIPMMHLSGATRDKTMKAFLEINGIEINSTMKRIEYGTSYSKIINDYINN